MVNFPLVSRALSFFPLSTPIKLIFPAWLPVAINLESGENATVHVSTKRNLTLTIKCNYRSFQFNFTFYSVNFRCALDLGVITEINTKINSLITTKMI